MKKQCLESPKRQKIEFPQDQQLQQLNISIKWGLDKLIWDCSSTLEGSRF